jgi:predicted RNase H-like HicB family nuclease
MNEMSIDAPHQLIEPNNSGDNFGLTVSQQPGLFYIGAKTAPNTDHNPAFMAAYVQASHVWMQAVWNFQVETRLLQSRWSETVIGLTNSVGSIQEKIDGLTSALDRLAEQRTFVVPLTTLAPDEPLQMRLNIPATIEGDGEDFTATFTEANVSASGDTEADAIANLKESIAATYKILAAIPASEMTPLPARQWSVLKNVIASDSQWSR